jgi:predicted enzyme related to lactoylglutathione lyase
MSNPVNWFQIAGKSAEPLVDFYGEVFEWKMKPGPGGMQFVQPEAGGIPGGIGPTMDGSAAHVTFYVGVDDIDATLACVSEAGGRPAMEKMPLPENMGWIAGFLDPAGNWVGLWQQGAPPPAPRKTARRASAKKAAAKKAVAKKAAPKKAAAKKAPKKTAKKAMSRRR